MISLIWGNSSRYVCLPSLVVIVLMEMEISILISILTWIPQTKLNSPTQSAILRDFLNQEYWYHRKVEPKELKQLQSVMLYKQTQQIYHISMSENYFVLFQAGPFKFYCYFWNMNPSEFWSKSDILNRRNVLEKNFCGFCNFFSFPWKFTSRNFLKQHFVKVYLAKFSQFGYSLKFIQYFFCCFKPLIFQNSKVFAEI